MHLRHTVKRAASLPFAPVTLRGGETHMLNAHPVVPFYAKWMVLFGQLENVMVEAVYVGNEIAGFVSAGCGGIPAENWSVGAREKVLDALLRLAPEHWDLLEGLLAPFKLGAAPCSVGNIISVRLRFNGHELCERTVWCAMFGEALWGAYDDPVRARFDDTELPDVSRAPSASPTLPSAAPPTVPPVPAVEPAPESEPGAWASPNWEEP
jgi:hypothetical protein